MLKKIMAQNYFCGLDLGAMTVKAALIRNKNQESAQLLGVYEVRTQGIENGLIKDMSDFSECIHAVLSGLSARTGVRIKEIQLGVCGQIVEKRYSDAVVPLLDRGNKVISTQDLRKVDEQARILGVHFEETVLHNFPQFYKVDDVNPTLNPMGLYGRKIEVHALLLFIKNIILQNFIRAVHQAGFEVSHVFYTAYSSSLASLSEYHRLQGCILVDMGTRSSDILIFRDGILRYVVNIPLGAEHLTQSLANRLSLSFELAQEIKHTYAHVLGSEPGSDEEILIKSGEGYLSLTKQMISQGIESAVSRFIDLVNEAVKNSGLAQQIQAGLIITGGGALLPGLEERLEKAMSLPVKSGKVIMAGKQFPQGVKFCGAIGLAQAGLSRSWAGISLKSQSAQYPLGQKFRNKIVELYQEYF